MLPIPSYTFVFSSGQRTFFHRWHFGNNEVIECNKCGTICQENDAYSQHWQQQKTKLSEVGDELNAWQRTAIMEHQADIVSQSIESYMLCDGKVVTDTQQFLLDAALTAIPDLLSVLFATDGCKHLLVILRFYVEIEGEMFMLQSNELAIRHHCDVRESVDVIFSMLLEKLRAFMTCMPGVVLQDRQPDYRIKRIHIRARRRQRINNEPLQMPLQYQRKFPLQKISEIFEQQHTQLKLDLNCLTAAYEKHLNAANCPHFKPPFPCNLYCFQICANSRELYAVPYHLSNSPATLLTTRSFVILDDILGRFQQLQEIDDIKRFLQHIGVNKVLRCRLCRSKYMQPTKLAIHEELNCGKNFEILNIDKDFVEIYDRCIEIMRCTKWVLYGIVQ